MGIYFWATQAGIVGFELGLEKTIYWEMGLGPPLHDPLDSVVLSKKLFLNVKVLNDKLDMLISYTLQMYVQWATHF